MTVMFMVMMWRGPIDWADGLILLVCLCVFLSIQYNKARTARNGNGIDYDDEVGKVPTRGRIIAGLLVAGLVALPLGANLTVDSAVEIAKRWSISEEVIGLTVIAIGTSLPELATGVMAARNRSGAVAMGNVVGSNLFNIAAIMGVTATVATVEAGSHIVSLDMWVMLAATLFLISVPATGMTIGRKWGAVLTVSYLCYLAVTVIF